MIPSDLIDAYAEDVARRLPRKQRNDVGYEIRALLKEELDAKSHEMGRAPDEIMVMDLLRAFGRPADVAARYLPPGFAVIEAKDARSFVRFAVAGFSLQWVLTLAYTFSQPGGSVGQAGSMGENLHRLGQWWLSGGLGAFWWPGFMVALYALGAWIKRRFPSADEWKPRLIDRDRISRPLWAVGITAALCGIAILVSLATLNNSSSPFAKAIALDQDFVRERAPWLLLFWIGHLSLYAILIAHGRWRKLTRWLDVAFSLIGCALMVWFLASGSIWRAEPADRTAKFAIALIIVIVLIDVGVKVLRVQGRIQPPGTLAKRSNA